MSVDVAALEAMVAGGATAEQVLNAVRDAHAAEEAAAAARREKEAARVRRHRANKRNAYAKDVTRTCNAYAPSIDATPTPAHTSGGQAQDVTRTEKSGACNVYTSSLFEEGGHEEERKSPTEIVEGRKTGTRLPRDAILSEEDRLFARSPGFSDAEITEMWAEFRDYWVGVPGQRGRKLDWSATWRNRVRDVAGRRRPQNGQHRQTGDGNRSKGLGFSAYARRSAAKAAGYG